MSRSFDARGFWPRVARRFKKESKAKLQKVQKRAQRFDGTEVVNLIVEEAVLRRLKRSPVEDVYIQQAIDAGIIASV